MSDRSTGWIASAGLLALAAACGGTEPGREAEAGAPRYLSIGTAPAGGAFFPVGGAIAEVLDSADRHDWRVTAEATAGSQENIRHLVSGQIDLALSNAAITYHAVRGEGEWEHAAAVRAVMTLAPNVALFVAPAGAGVSAIGDLRGKRVTVGPAGAGFEYFLRPILAAHGLGYEDFTPLYAEQTGAVDMLADGSVAAAFLGGAVPTASITQASTSGDVVFLPYDPAAVDELVARYVFFRRATIPPGTYRGQQEPFAGLDVGSMHLITAADAPEELIHELTRAIWDNRERVAEKHPAGRAINEANAARDTGTPFHPGAERFYREAGIWPEAGAGAETAAAGEPEPAGE